MIRNLIAAGFILLVCCPAFAQNTAEELYSAGQEAFNQGDVNKAISFYERAIEVNPDFALAYTALGQVSLENNGQLNDIVWLFEQAAILDPKSSERYTDLCRVYFQFREHDLAEAACLKALSMDPGSGSAQLTLAWVYLIGKVQPTDAIHYFNEVLKKTQSPKIYLGLGMAYARHNEHGRVLEIVTLLRGKGEELLARQLEKMIRPSDEMTEQPTSVIEANPSKIVKGSPDIMEPPVPSTGSLGTQKIQLRGKISFIPPKSAQPKPAASGENDESAASEVHESTVQERMEKVRKMMGNRMSGHARGTASFKSSGSATGTVQITPPPAP